MNVILNLTSILCTFWSESEFTVSHAPHVRRGLRGVQSKEVQPQQEDRQAAEERIQGGPGEVRECQTGKQIRCVCCIILHHCCQTLYN